MTAFIKASVINNVIIILKSKSFAQFFQLLFFKPLKITNVCQKLTIARAYIH